MGIESAKAYLERMRNDEEFRKKVLVCTDAKSRMALVNAEGFDFTEEDIKVVTAALGDKELASAAGGWWCLIYQRLGPS